MDFRQPGDRMLNPCTRKVARASQRALASGLFLIVIVVLLLSRGGWRLGRRR
jgi:hypothetical protein